jgi:hypothetical protein
MFSFASSTATCFKKRRKCRVKRRTHGLWETDPSASNQGAPPVCPWFLRDFFYDPESLGREEIDEKALAGLRGVVKIRHSIVNGTSLLNFDGFAPPASGKSCLLQAVPGTMPCRTT